MDAVALSVYYGCMAMLLHGCPYCTPQVSEREAAEAARKAARQSAADRIYDKLRLEKEAALRAQVDLDPFATADSS